MTWLKLGRKCWHTPTKRPVEILNIQRDGKVKIRPRDGQPLRYVIVPPADLQVLPPQFRHSVAVYSESELEAAKAWGMKPWEVRKIRGGAK